MKGFTFVSLKHVSFEDKIISLIKNLLYM